MLSNQISLWNAEVSHSFGEPSTGKPCIMIHSPTYLCHSCHALFVQTCLQSIWAYKCFSLWMLVSRKSKAFYWVERTLQLTVMFSLTSSNHCLHTMCLIYTINMNVYGLTRHDYAGGIEDSYITANVIISAQSYDIIIKVVGKWNDFRARLNRACFLSLCVSLILLVMFTEHGKMEGFSGL